VTWSNHPPKRSNWKERGLLHHSKDTDHGTPATTRPIVVSSGRSGAMHKAPNDGSSSLEKGADGMNVRFVSNSTFGTLAGVSSTLGNFVSGLIVARLLGVEATGAVSFVTWIAVISATIAGAGIPFTIGRYLPELTARHQDGEARQLAAYLLRPFSAMVLSVSIGFIGYGCWLWQRVGALTVGPTAQPLEDPLICICLGLCIAALAFADFGRGYLRGWQRFKDVALVTIVAVVVQILVIGVATILCGVPGAIFGLRGWMHVAGARQHGGDTKGAGCIARIAWAGSTLHGVPLGRGNQFRIRLYPGRGILSADLFGKPRRRPVRRGPHPRQLGGTGTP